MRTLYCSICSANFDVDSEGIEGDIGIIPVAFCATCKTGIHDFAQQTWDLVPREDFGEPCKNPMVRGFRRCRMHGARSPGARGSSNGNFRTGEFTQESVAKRREDMARVRELARLARQIGMID